MLQKSIDIICPLYKAYEHIERLHNSFLIQKEVKINKIRYVLTECNDGTEEYLIDNNISYRKIKKEDFSHSLVREREALESDSDILVFVTQDVVIEDDLWLYNLIKDLDDENIVASFSRQITKYNNIEKYTRESNYPDTSYVVSKEDIDKYRLKTFFFSDASSAIVRNAFLKVNGYDNKNLPISEDMYIAYKLIMNGYKIKYCSDSIVYHSHNFTLKQLYERYKLTGQFFKGNPYLDQYHATKSGANLAKYILKRIMEERNYKLLFRYPFDMAARYIGMKVGKIS